MADVTIRHFGGLGVIGGSKILISTPSARVLLDVGEDSLAVDLFAHADEHRGRLELVDRLRTGHAPQIPGLFDPDLLPPDSPLAEEDPRPFAVFLSHAHIDHDGLLKFVRPGLEIHAHPDTVRLERALATAGTSAPASWVPVAEGEHVQVGDLDVEMVRVDHDVPGACGILVHTPEGLIAYTGDINVHRDAAVHTQEFIRRASGCDLLVSETTGLSWDESQPPRTEEEVAGLLSAALEGATGLQLLSAYVRDVERMRLIVDVAARHGRTILLPGTDAVALALLGLDGVATWAGTVPQREIHHAAFRSLEDASTATAAGLRRVGLDEVRAHPDRWLVGVDADDPAQLGDLPVGPTTRWIHSQGEPLGPFMENWAPMMDWLGHFGIETVNAGSTGHACGDQIIGIATAIHPRRIHAIHGMHPERMVVPGVPVIVPEADVTYRLTQE